MKETTKNNALIEKAAIEINNLSVYYGKTRALNNISLSVPRGEYLGIIGPNGGGKSTLLKAMLGLVPKDAGDINIYGKPSKLSRGEVGYVPQFAFMERKFPITVMEVALTGFLQKGVSPFHAYTNGEKEHAAEILGRVGIGGLYDRQVSALSGGEFQKMLIARAIAANPKLILLDEPTASVDANSREQIYSLLAELNETMTVVLVTHDLLAVSSLVKSLACLNGSLVYHGEPKLNSETVNSLYGCPVDLIAHGVPHRVLGEHIEK
ncbi:MAG: ABC transporter ATP-binding protein [Eubacteriales bacterium]